MRFLNRSCMAGSWCSWVFCKSTFSPAQTLAGNSTETHSSSIAPASWVIHWNASNYPVRFFHLSHAHFSPGNQRRKECNTEFQLHTIYISSLLLFGVVIVQVIHPEATAPGVLPALEPLGVAPSLDTGPPSFE